MQKRITVSRIMLLIFSATMVLPVSSFGAWVNATGTLAGKSCGFAGICRVFGVPNTNQIIAGLSATGLWASSDGGVNWAKMGGSSGVSNRPSDILFDPADPKIFWEVGTYGNSIFKTTDGGVTISALGGIGGSDGLSIDFTDPLRLTMVATGHEGHQVVWKSVNGGVSFTSLSSSFPANTAFTSGVYVADSKTYVVSCGFVWGGGTSGMYRTTNGGTNWTSVSTQYAAGDVCVTSWGDVLFGNAAGGILKGSADGSTWTTINSGTSGQIIEIPGGKIAGLASNGIRISADHGNTWTTVAGSLPITPNGIAYNPIGGAFYAWINGDNNGTIADNAIWRYDTMLQAGLNIYSLHTAPSTFVNDKATDLTITVHAATTSGTIASVTLDLTSLGGAGTTAMTKGAGDLYTCTFSAAANLPAGIKTITATVTDNSSKQASTSATVRVSDPSGQMYYKAIYADSVPSIEGSWGWVSNGLGTQVGVIGTEDATGGYEGTHCMHLQFVVAQYWAGGEISFNKYGFIFDGTKYDSIGFYYKTASDVKFQIKMTFSNDTRSENAVTNLSGNGAWSHVSIPFSFISSAGYDIDSIWGLYIGINGNSATTPSGDLFIDNIYLVGSNPSSAAIDRRLIPGVNRDGIKAAKSRDVEVYDINGRVAGHQAKLTMGLNHAARVYLVKTTNGTVVKKIVR